MKRLFNWVAMGVVCATAFTTFSCEDDISDVGSGMIDSGSAAYVKYVDVVAYNTNNDSIRSDERVLQNAILGVYEEPVFGRTKAKFISQARPGSLNPDFGENAEVDSVILTIPVFYDSDEDNIDVDTITVYSAPEGSSAPDTIAIKRTYTLDSIYGNTSAIMTLQIREVADYLYSQDSAYYSNPNLANCTGCNNINDIEVLPTVLGSQTITNKITTYKKKAENAEDNTIPAVAIRIKLDKDYFKQKFIDNEGSSDLNDYASFIRNFFRGIELSVAEEQGFLMNFASTSSSFNLIMHYSYDNPSEDTEDEDYEARKSSSYGLSFSSIWSSTPGYNVQVSQFEHQNRGAQFLDSYTNPDKTNGASRLYLAGMDGTKTILKLNQDQLNEIRDNVLNNDWAIVGAELNFHVDDSYGLKMPPYLFAWNNYVEDAEIQNVNFSDITSFYNYYPTSVQFNPMYDYAENPKTYTIRITDYIKSIVEQGEVYEDGSVVVSLGNFMMNPTGSYTSVLSGTDPFYSNRAFNPYRVVLHGNATEQTDKKLRLKVYYTQK